MTFRSTFLYILLIVVLSFCAEARDLKVLTYNTYLLCVGPRCSLANSPDIKTRTKQIAEWLKEVDADVVFLQELWQQEQFEEIFKISGYKYAAHAGPNSELGILSKFPIKKSSFQVLSWQGASWWHCRIIASGTYAGLFSAEIEVNKELIVFASSHLAPRHPSIKGFDQPSDAATTDRKIHIQELMALLQRQHRNTKVIFGGDFNMNQFSDEYKYWMAQGWTDTLNEKVSAKKWRSLCTYCSESPLVKAQGNPGEGILDYIFVRPGEFQTLESRVVDDGDKFSDHKAVLTYLRPNPSQSFPPVYKIPAKREVLEFIKHLQTVSVDPWCYASPSIAFQQQKKGISFLKSLLTLTKP